MKKEVYFNEYCLKCKYKDTANTENPCNECLTHGGRKDSHKPIKFKDEKDES